MASSTTKVLCRYYMSNCCFKGDLCPFSHNWKDKPDTRCRYYMKGSCVNGKNCRYDHVKPQEEKLPNVSPHVKGVVSVPANLPSLSSTAHQQPAHTASKHKMMTLKEDPSRNPKKWVQATEFVPGKQYHGDIRSIAEATPSATVEQGNRANSFSYSGAVSGGLNKFLDVISPEEAASLLCPFAEMGHCPFERCEYLHGDVCDMCNRQCLNPFDTEQQKAHRRECLEMHEKEMEKAFQVVESEGKQCAICMDYVVAKLNMSDRRFGILADCEHCFCLGCIRKWRGSTHMKHKTIRACPLCRKISYFVIPSEVWIDDEKQKQRLIKAYKDNLGKKHCKYFSMGEGTCPFGASCFYRHEFPDGRKAEDIPRFYEDSKGDRRAVKAHTLWDYFSDREERSLDSYWGESSSNEEGSSEQIHGDRDWFWLTYEPDIDDLDFL